MALSKGEKPVRAGRRPGSKGHRESSANLQMIGKARFAREQVGKGGVEIDRFAPHQRVERAQGGSA
jgi:hypothetical protein